MKMLTLQRCNYDGDNSLMGLYINVDYIVSLRANAHRRCCILTVTGEEYIVIDTLSEVLDALNTDMCIEKLIPVSLYKESPT